MGKYDFKQLKSKVGIDDVAYELGYQLNRSAGVGRYIELVLPDGQGGHADTVVVSHPQEKARQRYFHRNGSSQGDVVNFIIENAAKYHLTASNQWDMAGQVLSRIAGIPVEQRKTADYAAAAPVKRDFDPERFDVLPVSADYQTALGLLRERKLTYETLAFFAEDIRLVRDKQSKFDRHILGFPYTDGGEAKGYELRGFGKFKGKAAGSNSSTAAWVVTRALDPSQVDKVYFAESAYDIMAFYQHNRLRIDPTHSAFVSLGGTFSNGQVATVRSRFPMATLVDCFDNDLPGRVYGLRLYGLANDRVFSIATTDDDVTVESKGKYYTLPKDKATVSELSKKLDLRVKTGTWKSPPNFKDWNDVVMGKPLAMPSAPTKWQRDEALQQRRTGMKM